MKKIKYFSIQFKTEVFVNNQKCYCAENTMVPVDIKTKKPMKIPDKLLNKITERTDITIC